MSLIGLVLSKGHPEELPTFWTKAMGRRRLHWKRERQGRRCCVWLDL